MDARPGPASRRVLVVEDSPAQALFMTSILEEAGLAVDTAPDVPQAITCLRSQAYDLVLTDLNLPGPSGFDLCRMVRANRDWATLPVVVITSDENPSNILHGLEVGACDFMTKGRDPAEIVSRVRRVLDAGFLWDPDERRIPIEVTFLGQLYNVSASRRDLLGVLLSSFEDMVHLTERLRELGVELERQRDNLRATLASVLDSVPVGIVVTESSGRSTMANVRARGLFGGDSPPVLSDWPAATGFRSTSGQPVSLDELPTRQTFADGQERRDVELEIGEDPEKKVSVLVNTSAIRDASKAITSVCSTFTEITGFKTAQRTAQRLQQELEHASRLAAVGQLAGGVAHEINNPLMIISGMSELLMSPELDEEQRTLIRSIHTASQRCGSIVKKLLAFARQDSGKVSPLSLNDQVEDACRFLERQLTVQNVQVVTHLAEALPTVMGDPQDIQQILTNLIVNAKDAMPAGGVVAITTRAAGEYVELLVSDTGVGIDPAILHRIFEPFFTTKEVGKGTGLGLSMVHTMVRNMRGQIRVDSLPDKGTTFTLIFPAAHAKPEVASPVRSPVHTRRPLRVLVVDDEPEIRELCRRHLRQDRHSYVEALDGAQAVTLLRAHTFDLVLLDIMMPHLSGVEVVQVMRSEKIQVPVVVMTGQIDPNPLRTLEAMGIVGVLRKPFHLTELREMLERASVPRHRLLVIGENSVFGQMIADHIESLGLPLEVVLTQSGFETGLKIDSLMPDVIVLDLGLAGASGLEICRILHQREVTSRPKIVVLLDPDGDVCQEAARASGADHVLEKPIDDRCLVELAGIVKHMMG